MGCGEQRDLVCEVVCLVEMLNQEVTRISNALNVVGTSVQELQESSGGLTESVDRIDDELVELVDRVEMLESCSIDDPECGDSY